MAESSDGKCKFELTKEFMIRTAEERKDIRRSKNKKTSRRYSEDIRTDAAPFDSADFEKIAVEDHHDRQDIDDRQQNMPMAVAHSYHDSHEALESTYSISGEEEANIVENDRTVFQHQTGAIPVESSYHGSSETAETASSAAGDTSLKGLVSANDNIESSQNKLENDEIGEVHSNFQIASGYSNEHAAVENSHDSSSHNKLENGETGNAQSNFKLPSDNSNVNFAIENSHDAVAVESRSRFDQTELQYLKEKIRSFEEEMARRSNLHDEGENKISKEVSHLQAVGHRQHEAHCNDIQSLQQDIQSLLQRLQRVENENVRLNRSVMFPASVDEWLGVDIASIRRTVLNEKMITYFSKVFNSPTLNITGIHLGFNESDVNRCTSDSNGTSRESCRLLLKYWCNKMGDKATIGYLLESLYRLSQHEPSCINKDSLDLALQKAKNSK